MDNKKILEKARQYIQCEDNLFFKKQVNELLNQIEHGGHDKKTIEDLNDRFYTDLKFGTGGLRGIIGGGFNRMNPYIVKRTTQGLTNYLLKHVPIQKASVVIAFDSRNFSDLFAHECAQVLAGNGITTYLFSTLRPTPELSFAIRYLGASAGIVITASHNPSEYNGYKVFWDDGAQIVPPHDKGIMDEVANVTGMITSLAKDDAIKKGLIVIINKEVDDAYYKMIDSLLLRRDMVKETGKNLKIVYTPLFGTGAVPVSHVLRCMGIKVLFVEDQKQPDGNFPGLKYPNPEEASAMKKALDYALKTNADIVMGTDPDSDRIGIAVPGDEKYQLITGNQLGVLLVDYVLSSRKELGILPKRAAVVKTIVTSELGSIIAGDYGVECYDTLTGFKNICSKIKDFEKQENGPEFLIGYEESYGYLIGTHVRDKDAVTTAAIVCEMALYYQSKGTSILMHLHEIYKKYGYFEEVLIYRYFKGETGLITMKNFMESLRTNPPSAFAGQQIIIRKDYKTQKILYCKTGETGDIADIPVSNVLQFILEDNSIISVRPSGTEPKIKFYASCRSKPGMDILQAKTIIGNKIDSIEKDINTIIEMMG